MNIGILSFSASGGAGIASANIARGLQELSCDVNLFFASQQGIRDAPFRRPSLTAVTIFDNHIVRSHGWGSTVSLNRDNLEEKIPLHVRQSEAFLVRWSVGLFGMRSEFFHNKKVIWTMPDMRSITGACHNSLHCGSYNSGCNDCPAVKPVFRSQVQRSLNRKSSFFNQIQDLTFVAHSENMFEKLQRSPISVGRRLEFVPNPVGPEFSQTPLRHSPKAKEKLTRLIIIADDLEDPIKGFHSISNDLLLLVRLKKINVKVIGRLSRKSQLDFLEFEFLGFRNASAIIEALDSSDILLLPSFQESAANVVAEAHSRGVPAIVREGSGVEEFVVSPKLVFKSNSELKSLLTTMEDQEMQTWSKLAKIKSGQHNYLDVAARYRKLLE